MNDVAPGKMLRKKTMASGRIATVSPRLSSAYGTGLLRCGGGA